jgi:hypothetical protein
LAILADLPSIQSMDAAHRALIQLSIDRYRKKIAEHLRLKGIAPFTP